MADQVDGGGPSGNGPAGLRDGAINSLYGERRGSLLGLLTGLSAGGLVGLLLGITAVVTFYAWPAYRQFGWQFIGGRQWNPITDNYGALPLIYGTLVSSFLALLIATPLGIGLAIFLTENLVPSKARHAFAFIVDLLAAIPSVIYGLWGIATVIPLTTKVGQWLFMKFPDFPLFSTPPVGPGMLPASLVLAIMILPTIAALSRSSLRNVPASYLEGAYALGATRWQVILQITLPSATTGIFGGVVLALGRAMGETMALAMLVGNSNRISPSLFSPGNTIASLLANSYGEAEGVQLSALMYLSFILMALTLLVNLIAQGLLIRAGGLRRATA